MRFLLFFVSFFCLSSQAVIPYQNCNPENENFTRSIIDELKSLYTEAEFCFACEQQNTDIVYTEVKELQDHFKEVIPMECFLAMSAKGNYNFKENRYMMCKTQHSSREADIANTKLCANEDYINLIHHAFSTMAKCFDFGPDKQKEVLALINQESKGILNIQSPSGARCLGQITKNYVKTMNNHIISSRSQNPIKYSEIYSELAQRCPQVEKLIVKTTKATNADRYLTCKTTRDPYSCLFYTFFGIEKSHREIQDHLNTTPDYMGNKEFTDEEKSRFKLPVQLNEMLKVTAEVGGQPTTMLFWGDSELYDFLEKAEQKKAEIKVWSTGKVPLFQEKKHIATMFKYWAHNGGGSYGRGKMAAMVKNLKIKLSKPCKNNSTQLRCKLREQMKNNKSLSAMQALQMFEYDLKVNYPNKDPGRRNEVANYVRNIIESNQEVFGYKKKSANTNLMIGRYQNFVKYRKKNKFLDKKSADEFQQLVDEKCPKLDFPI